MIGGWKKVEGDLPGLPQAAQGKVWAASVPEAKGGKWNFRQLWVNGKRLTRAQWPNVPEGVAEPGEKWARDRYPFQAIVEQHGNYESLLPNPGDDDYLSRRLPPGEIRFKVVNASLPSPDALKGEPALDRWRRELTEAWRTVEFRAEDLRLSRWQAAGRPVRWSSRAV